MEKLKHIVPTKEYEDKAIDYINEFYEYNSKIHGVGELHKYLDRYDDWLIRLSNDRKGLTNVGVPTETFFLLREKDNKIVGMINIRITKNETLIKQGGHIGYSIRPTERCKGYNKINLYLGLKFLAENNIDVALLGCVKSNLASSKTMLALGAIKYEENYNEQYCEIVERYKINIKKSLEKYIDLYHN